MADIFEKMKDGFNKSVATVSTGSKNIVEKSKINSFIKTTENERSQLVALLGNKVYSLYNASPEADIANAEVASICNEISVRNAQLEEYKKQIAQLDAEMNMVTGTAGNNFVNKPCICGHINSPGARFCAKCGSKLQD